MDSSIPKNRYEQISNFIVLFFKICNDNKGRCLNIGTMFYVTRSHLLVKKTSNNQVVKAQRLTRRLATGENLGSNPGKGDNLLISY